MASRMSPKAASATVRIRAAMPERKSPHQLPRRSGGKPRDQAQWYISPETKKIAIASVSAVAPGLPTNTADRLKDRAALVPLRRKPRRSGSRAQS